MSRNDGVQLDYDEEVGDNISVTTSMFSDDLFRYKDSRRFTYNATYFLPNDKAEQDRLNLQHHIFKLALGTNCLLPVDYLKRPKMTIIDLGTGPGLWCIEMANEFKNARVIGLDLSDVAPIDAPPNCTFEVGDCNENLRFRDNRFGVVHCRMMVAGIKNWDFTLAEMKRICRPGGFVVLYESTFKFYTKDGSTSAMEGLNRGTQILTAANGVDINRPDSLKALMEEDGGLVNVSEQIVEIPCGIWPKDPKEKEIGRLFNLDCVEAVNALTAGYKFVMPEDDANKIREECQAELKVGTVPAYIVTRYIIGQKARPE